MIFGLIILACGAGLYLYNSYVNNKVEKSNLNTVTQIEETIDSKSSDENLNSDQQSYIIIDGVNYIGIIYIPILNNLALPVIQECTDENLKVSICRYSGSINKNNIVIAGHRYKSTFAKLANLEVGNIIYFKDINGNVFKYKLKTTETLSPNEVYEMQVGDWDLTLFTCTYDSRKRVAYRFELD